MTAWRFLLALSAAWAAGGSLWADSMLRIDGALVTVIDEASVPAQDAGVLRKLAAAEGQLVEAGDVLAQLDSDEARIARDRARIVADIARKEAGNNVKVRFARKAAELARAELKRATDSVEKFRKSVSESELDALRLAVEKGALESEQADHDYEIARLTAALRENDLELATQQLGRRTIMAPLGGVVVEIKLHPGEFVEPGQTVLRIVRLDRLRAEGFAPATQAAALTVGGPVQLVVEVAGEPLTLEGTLAFVSPEVNPVSGQVRLWAEFENPQLRVRPGLKAVITVRLASKGS